MSWPLTHVELQRVESLLNGWVTGASPTTTTVMGLDEARVAAATAMVRQKYADVGVCPRSFYRVVWRWVGRTCGGAGAKSDKCLLTSVLLISHVPDENNEV